MRFGWLKDKQLRLVAKALSTFLGSILLFAGLVNLLGYINTAFITIVGALVLWIISGQVVNKASPTGTSQEAKPQPSVSPRIISNPGTYRIEAGRYKDIPLDVKKGDRIKGHLKEVDDQTFDYYIADEQNMVFFRRHDFRRFRAIDKGVQDLAYRISLRIPHAARWYLILDMAGLKNDREVHVDFEPITPPVK